jgi:hypothetical protein
MIAVGIITAPRERPTLVRSVESFKAAGFQTAVVFAEPGSEACVADGVHTEQNAIKRGNFRNYIHALRQLFDQTTFDWIMICEDDIQWARDAAAALTWDLAHWSKDDRVGAISLYCPIRVSKVLEKKYGLPLVQGFYQLNLGRGTWGAQCQVYHRSWAALILHSSLLNAYLQDPRWDKNVDHLVAQVLASKGREIMYRIPCLVDHTFGDGNSSLGYKPDRPELKTRYFQG